jgi:drug/metabolite transporter (DMT)-like permease
VVEEAWVKKAESLKGFATALSVILTGLLSMMLFGIHLSIMYFIGIALVVAAVVLYNGQEAWWCAVLPGPVCRWLE